MSAHSSQNFPQNAANALNNKALQKLLVETGPRFVGKRAKAYAALPEFEALRQEAVAIKNNVLAHLDAYLEIYEQKVLASGGQLHWARDAAEAREIILEICKSAKARSVTKGKSMVTEEIGLNDALTQAGITPIETDLGEYLIQLRGETPSHIIAPAVHLSRDQIEADFRLHHSALDYARDLSSVEQLVNEAREILRQKYFAADVGITGANFLVAETGSSIIVTNEGNGDLTQTLAPVHIVVSAIEKIVPTLEDATTLIRLLARSATGQEISTYTSFSTGPKREGDLDGPQAYHVVLLDNGRSNLLGGSLQDMLRCIRCGACLNHCPVYQALGGHAYGSVYPGPIGSAFTPQIVGLDAAHHLPQASTLCGRCAEVCPMKIPLPQLLRQWREKEFEQHLTPKAQRRGLKLWGFLARHPKLYGWLTNLAALTLYRLGRKRGTLRSLPLAKGWTLYRDLPVPQGKSFQKQWNEKMGHEKMGNEKIK